MADTAEGYAAIQRDLNRLERWADRTLMKLKKGKHKVLHLRRSNPRHCYRLTGWKAALQKETWGSWWTPS